MTREESAPENNHADLGKRRNTDDLLGCHIRRCARVVGVWRTPAAAAAGDNATSGTHFDAGTK